MLDFEEFQVARGEERCKVFVVETNEGNEIGGFNVSSFCCTSSTAFLVSDSPVAVEDRSLLISSETILKLYVARARVVSMCSAWSVMDSLTVYAHFSTASII